MWNNRHKPDKDDLAAIKHLLVCFVYDHLWDDVLLSDASVSCCTTNEAGGDLLMTGID